MPDLLPPHLDLVTLKLVNGDDIRVKWCDPLVHLQGEIARAILIPRWPATFEEQTWMWTVLPTRLIPGASVKLV